MENIMAIFEQTFLEQVTQIHGQLLMDWVKRQPWRAEFFGGEKIPSRLLHPPTLITELARYLGG